MTIRGYNYALVLLKNPLVNKSKLYIYIYIYLLAMVFAIFKFPSDISN